MNIKLRIDELVLEGFAAGDRYRIAAAVEAELMRLFTDRGAPPGLANGGAVPALDGGSFAVTPGAKPEQVGAQVAGAVYGGLSR